MCCFAGADAEHSLSWACICYLGVLGSIVLGRNTHRPRLERVYWTCCYPPHQYPMPKHAPVALFTAAVDTTVYAHVKPFHADSSHSMIARPCMTTFALTARHFKNLYGTQSGVYKTSHHSFRSSSLCHMGALNSCTGMEMGEKLHPHGSVLTGCASVSGCFCVKCWAPTATCVVAHLSTRCAAAAASPARPMAHSRLAAGSEAHCRLLLLSHGSRLANSSCTNLGSCCATCSATSLEMASRGSVWLTPMPQRSIVAAPVAAAFSFWARSSEPCLAHGCPERLKAVSSAAGPCQSTTPERL